MALVQAGLNAGLEQIYVIPALPVHRELSGHADARTRFDWLVRMFSGEPHVQVVDWEYRRRQPTAAIETLRRFVHFYPGTVPWLMLGADAWAGLPTWREYPAHCKLCNVAVFARSGPAVAPVCGHDGWQQLDLKTGGLSAGLDCNAPGHWIYIQADLPDISATELRRDVQSGRALADRVPAVICRDIEQAYGGKNGDDVTQAKEKNHTENNQTFEQMTAALIEALEDKKATDVLVIDVRGRCDFADRFILASGRSDRQLKALAQSVGEVAHRFGLSSKVEGLEASEWLLVDLGDIIIHLFLPEARESFQLERLWSAPHGDAVSS